MHKRVIATAPAQVWLKITFNMINSSQFHQELPTCGCFIENNLSPVKDRPSDRGRPHPPPNWWNKAIKLPTSKLNQLRGRYKQKHGNTWAWNHRCSHHTNSLRINIFPYDKSLKARGPFCFVFLDYFPSKNPFGCLFIPSQKSPGRLSVTNAVVRTSKGGMRNGMTQASDSGEMIEIQ